MQKINKIIENWPKFYISFDDLINQTHKTRNSLHGIIKRAIQKGDLQPLKKGLYLISSKEKKSQVSSFSISGILYGPSYISFESALSYHGWIPEAVYRNTCATSKRTTHFETPIGPFSYFHIPTKVFHLGVFSTEIDHETFLIASGWKALADYIYIKRKEWDNINQLSSDLRVEREVLFESDPELLLQLSKEYPSKRTRQVLLKLFKNIHL